MADSNFDLALIIALDGSASVNFAEFNLITLAMAAAFVDPDVVTGLNAGRGSMLSLLLWSGVGAQEVMVDWTLIRTPADADAFSRKIADVPRSVPAGQTAIGEALAAAERLFAALPGAASRKVVDVVGDGRSNAGIPPGPVRDRLNAAGVTINGLCVLHEEADLLASYTAEVIGGPGAFALACADYDDFAEAMRRKLLREIAWAE
jgi:hypothetical protein